MDTSIIKQLVGEKRAQELKLAHANYLATNNDYQYDAFPNGAYWADTHPSDALLRKISAIAEEYIADTKHTGSFYEYLKERFN